MSNPMTKSNEGFRVKNPEAGSMHEVTVRMWLSGNPGEIHVLKRASESLGLLARHGYMPANTQTVTREVVE